MTVATQRATRNGEPAYLKAPPRLTQSMVDVQRTLTQRHSMAAELKRLAADVDRLHHTDTGCPDFDRKQPGIGKGSAIAVLAGLAWLIVGVIGAVLL